MTTITNPYIEANGQNNNITRDDVYWSVEQEQVLLDTYMMLRDAGLSRDDCQLLREFLDRTTLYSAEEAEQMYQSYVENEE